MSTQIPGVLLCLVALGLAWRARRVGSSTPLLAGLILTAVAAVALLVYSPKPLTEPIEEQSRQVAKLCQEIPLAHLSKKIGGSGKIAVLVNRSSIDGTTSQSSAERVAAWQERWPQHSFILVASLPNEWSATLARLANESGLAAIVLLESPPSEALAVTFLDPSLPVLPPLLCLNRDTTEELLPLIRSGKIFAGLRNRSRAFQADPKASPQELFDKNFALVDQQMAEAELNTDHDALVSPQTEGQ